MPGQHSQPTPTWLGRARVNVCLGVTCHLHFWQNDWGLLHANAVTWKKNGQQTGVSTESQLWRRKLSSHSCQHLNLQLLDHESSVLMVAFPYMPCLTIHSLPACFFFLIIFFKVEISSHTQIPLFRPGSVHSVSLS